MRCRPSRNWSTFLCPKCSQSWPRRAVSRNSRSRHSSSRQRSSRSCRATSHRLRSSSSSSSSSSSRCQYCLIHSTSRHLDRACPTPAALPQDSRHPSAIHRSSRVSFRSRPRNRLSSNSHLSNSTTQYPACTLEPWGNSLRWDLPSQARPASSRPGASARVEAFQRRARIPGLGIFLCALTAMELKDLIRARRLRAKRTRLRRRRRRRRRRIRWRGWRGWIWGACRTFSPRPRLSLVLRHRLRRRHSSRPKCLDPPTAHHLRPPRLSRRQRRRGRPAAVAMGRSRAAWTFSIS